MCEWLFIDGIDHEWCFRAQYNGLEIVRSNYRVMDHNMGDGGLTLLGRYRPLHANPIRHFYIVRNTIYLSKMSYISVNWRIWELLKLSYRIPTYMLISSDRIESVRKITSGFWQGIRSTSNKNGNS
jgi:rhamnosyltransferase